MDEKMKKEIEIKNYLVKLKQEFKKNKNNFDDREFIIISIQIETLEYVLNWDIVKDAVMVLTTMKLLTICVTTVGIIKWLF